MKMCRCTYRYLLHNNAALHIPSPVFKRTILDIPGYNIHTHTYLYSSSCTDIYSPLCLLFS